MRQYKEKLLKERWLYSFVVCGNGATYNNKIYNKYEN